MSLRFPATRIASLAEFQSWLHQMQPQFDQRWLYEQQQVKSGLSATRDGTCGLCLTPAIFHSALPPENRNWREEMNCNCGHRLSNRERAVLHFLNANMGIVARQRIALVGPEIAIETPLVEAGLHIAHLPRLINGRLAAKDRSADHVICTDYLQYVPPLRLLLDELSRLLCAGGNLLLTVPFDTTSAHTKSFPIDLPHTATDTAHSLHLFGWDLLDILRDMGYSDVVAHFYWSDEFAYLGPFNMIISATRLA